MPKDTWLGPYVLSEHNINKHIQEEGPGVYLLGTVGQDGKMNIKHVHSAANIKQELRRWLGESDVFMFERVGSVMQALIDRHAISELALNS